MYNTIAKIFNSFPFVIHEKVLEGVARSCENIYDGELCKDS